jgi:DNA-binding CsgD family transcriptional regulator
LPAGITARELDILQLVVRGNSDRQIGEDLYLSPRTVNAHIRHMLAKTTLSNRTELSVWAVEQGIVER